ncbi:MAG: thioredoxin-dependent thiol peroxidase [Flavobacteriales bacterium]|nr:thioredoxin-dependent thiol peroxidase [Flavobacteriales bacterium]
MKRLKAGDKAPYFEGTIEDGSTVSLGDFSGKKLILFIYPKDNTPGCTAQNCNLAENFEELKKKGFELLGISADNEKKHQNFIEKYKLPFHLIADTDHKIIDAYGSWGLKKFMGREYDGIHRTTFIIENGVIKHVIEKVNTKNHSAQILEICGE